MRMNSTTAVACFAPAAFQLSSDTHASPRFADYSARPVRMVIPLALGGGSDIVGRIAGTAIVTRAPADVAIKTARITTD